MVKKLKTEIDDNTIRLTPAFKLIFSSILLLTVGAFLSMLLMAIFIQAPNGEVTSAIDTCSTAYKMGIGAIFGLISGKAA